MHLQAPLSFGRLLILAVQACTVVKLKQVLWESKLCDTFVYHMSIVHVTDLHLCLMSFLPLNNSAKLCNLSHLTELHPKNVVAMPELSYCPKQYHTSWDQLGYVDGTRVGLCTCDVARRAITDVMHMVKSDILLKQWCTMGILWEAPLAIMRSEKG